MYAGWSAHDADLGAPSSSANAAWQLARCPGLAQQSVALVQSSRRPNWLEVKDGYDYCSLCRHFATDGHLASERHKARALWQEWSESQAQAPAEDLTRQLGPPAAWGDPAHFEFREGWWWCRLCQQWSDAGHVEGKRHLKRAHWCQWYGIEDDGARSDPGSGSGHGEDSAASTSAGTSATRRSTSASEDEPWGPAWAASVRLPKASPGWRSAFSQDHGRTYFFNPTTGERCWELPAGAPSSSKTAAEALQAALPAAAKLPSAVRCPWVREWSQEHQAHYFWHEGTGDTTWDLPEGLVLNGAEVEWL